jgi:hypothetical protein
MVLDSRIYVKKIYYYYFIITLNFYLNNIFIIKYPTLSFISILRYY